MSQSIPLSELEQSPSAKFLAIGDAYKGRIVSLDRRQNTKPDGSPAFFPSGDPQMILVITIEQPDGERLALWAGGGKFEVATGEGQAMLTAITAAALAAGAQSLSVGDEVAVAHTGMGKVTSAGKNPPRLYKAQYKLAAATPTSVPLNLFDS